MFKINYRITSDLEELKHLSEQKIREGVSIEGFFELEINDKKYGYYKSGPLQIGEEGLDLITEWFEGLLTVLIALKKSNSYVALSDIDSYNTWLEFKSLQDGMVSISVIMAEKESGSGQVETEPLKNAIYSDWANEVISYDEMLREVINKANEYCSHLNEINEKLVKGNRFIQLKNLELSLEM